MLQLWLQLISLLCCSEGERVSMCICERAGRNEGGTERQHVHQRTTFRTLDSDGCALFLLLLSLFSLCFYFGFFFFTFSTSPFVTASSFPCPLLLLLILFSCSSPAFCSYVACWRWHLQFWGAGAGSPPASLSSPTRSSANGLPGPGFTLSRLVLQQSVNNIDQIWVSATCLLALFDFFPKSLFPVDAKTSCIHLSYTPLLVKDPMIRRATMLPLDSSLLGNKFQVALF